ncbi:MAG: hypothetical protein IAE84_17555 [Saprospiraceae bacterium]|nr:hypothetical protein [Saprospiraceae bacterium]
MSRYSYIFLLFAALSVVAVSCDDSAKQKAQEEALLQSRLLERLEMGRTARREECMRQLADSALVIVDSIRLEEARWALDTLRGRPYKPFRPDNPGPGASVDSLEVKPLLPDSIKRRNN